MAILFPLLQKYSPVGDVEIATGRLIQLMRGIYVDVADDVDATVLKHAVRFSR